MSEHVSTTPSGIEITFEDGEPDETGKSKKRTYTVNGEKFPSVTTVLGILDKPALKNWAQKVGVTGAIELAREGVLPLHPEGALSAMKSRGLQFWQVSGRAAERGELAHSDLLALATGGELSDLDSVPEEQQGFVRGVSAWYADHRPTVIDSERMVASLKHRFSGRLDLRAELVGYEGIGLLDLKTTEALPRYKDGRVKPPYPESLMQLEGYELAAIESGLGSSSYRAVIRVDATGEYDMTVSWADPEDFLGVLAAHTSLKALGSRRPSGRAKAPA